MKKAAKAWSVWEGRTSKLKQDPWEKVLIYCIIYSKYIMYC